MNIVFDMDNTLSDELGKCLRPGIVELLERLENDGHILSLWTSSTRERALSILYGLKLREHFKTLVYREDYDPENVGLGKDIREICGDFLIDDDPYQVEYAKSIGKKGYLVKAFRAGNRIDSHELEDLYLSIKYSSHPFGSLIKWVKMHI